MEGEKRAPEVTEPQHSDWLLRTLGPDWVEVEPGIFQPPTAREPEPEPEPHEEPAPESLDQVLWPRVPEHTTPEPTGAPAKRGWWRRG